eukprot:4291031-Alexandrium_andersonii.AAC.1
MPCGSADQRLALQGQSALRALASPARRGARSRAGAALAARGRSLSRRRSRLPRGTGRRAGPRARGR